MRRMRSIHLGKVAIYAIVINAVQIALVASFVAYALFIGQPRMAHPLYRAALLFMGALTCWGAVVDIREAISARHVEQQADMLEEANRRMDQLNLTLRAQRHDFQNHLQVVYSLMEMDEKQAAIDYLEAVFQDLQRVGRTLKSQIPAVNALLAAKLAECDKRGVLMNLDIQSGWSDLPAEGWEICRALGNLIDNALDALSHTPSPVICLTLGETLKEYTFQVSNNGPQVPVNIQEAIFQEGFSTKGCGRGMGLSIVQEIMRSHGGEIVLSSAPGQTCFSGKLPKAGASASPLS